MIKGKNQRNQRNISVHQRLKKEKISVNQRKISVHQRLKKKKNQRNQRKISVHQRLKNNSITMKNIWFVPAICLAFLGCTFAQIPQDSKTANDFVLPNKSPFRYGANMGYYPSFNDEKVADLGAKVDVNSLRLGFFESFAEYWGYDIRESAFRHYDSLGMTENVCFLGYPSPNHRDNTIYCGKDSSALFANMYEPIWDKGENGTPVNDKNYYALYVYKTVKKYEKTVKFWEIWNEPDYATTFKSEMAAGLPGAWWNTNPDPCEYALHAPIQHYIRLLRISYEVIKSLDSKAFVCVGGLGFPSFLDALLRQTDNPSDGSKTPQYPMNGGAYFDVLSYHSYPHIDNSVRAWSDKISGFEYFRHSDRAVEGVFNHKKGFETVLEKYGYEGQKYPKKHFIITECNLPAKAIGEFMGSYEAQRNFTIKALVKAQVNNLLQYHVYQLGEISEEKECKNEFDLMGLYHKLEKDKLPQVTESGVAFYTTSQILYGLIYNFEETKKLNLPTNVDGAAFKNPKTNEIIYCLWAKTSIDQLEQANAVFDFPKPLSIKQVRVRNWNFSTTNKSVLILSKNIKLTGTPIFLSP